jgi:hypothetical protein
MINWFRLARLFVELRHIRKALERIADAQESSLGGRSTGLRSHYRGTGHEGADLLYTDDDALAALERIDRAAAETGVEPIEGFDDLSELEAGGWGLSGGRK